MAQRLLNFAEVAKCRHIWSHMWPMLNRVQIGLLLKGLGRQILIQK